MAFFGYLKGLHGNNVVTLEKYDRQCHYEILSHRNDMELARLHLYLNILPLSFELPVVSYCPTGQNTFFCSIIYLLTVVCTYMTN